MAPEVRGTGSISTASKWPMTFPRATPSRAPTDPEKCLNNSSNIHPNGPHQCPSPSALRKRQVHNTLKRLLALIVHFAKTPIAVQHLIGFGIPVTAEKVLQRDSEITLVAYSVIRPKRRQLVRISVARRARPRWRLPRKARLTRVATPPIAYEHAVALSVSFDSVCRCLRQRCGDVVVGIVGECQQRSRCVGI